MKGLIFARLRQWRDGRALDPHNACLVQLAWRAQDHELDMCNATIYPDHVLWTIKLIDLPELIKWATALGIEPVKLTPRMAGTGRGGYEAVGTLAGVRLALWAPAEPTTSLPREEFLSRVMRRPAGYGCA